MLNILRDSNNPHINLATEEYVLHSFQQDVLMLWINRPSVIIGKHQNAFAEVNHSYLNRVNLPIIRRITGGGTVYHDEGNLNYTLITSGIREKLVDYERFTLPIIEFLKGFGIYAKLENKSNLTINGLKFSGNAEHVYKNRVLHHGTLLYNTDLEILENVINKNRDNYSDKAVKSVISNVTNLSSHLNNSMTINEFKESLEDHFQKTWKNFTRYSFSDKEFLDISQLGNEKYRSWEWNFAYSPPYKLKNTIRLQNRVVTISIFVKKGHIAGIEIDGLDLLGKEIEKSLLNAKHYPSDIENKIRNCTFANHIDDLSLNDLINSMIQ